MSYSQTYPTLRTLEAWRGDTVIFSITHEFKAKHITGIRAYVRTTTARTSRLVLAFDAEATPDNFIVEDGELTWIILPSDSQESYGGSHWYDVELVISEPGLYNPEIPAVLEEVTITIQAGSFMLQPDTTTTDEIQFLTDTPRIKQPVTGFGATGDFTYISEEQPNANYPIDSLVTTYFPVDAASGARLPGRAVILFCHGYYAADTAWYQGLLEHLASWGFVVVHVSYKVDASSIEEAIENYYMLRDGFAQAIASYPTEIDSTRVGWCGHSFGAGAIPYLVWHGLTQSGLGTAGSAAFIMAPYYSWLMDDAAFAQIPATTQLVMQVYSEDVNNDPRMAIDLYFHFTGPAPLKDYLRVNSDSQQWRSYTADHRTPGCANFRANNLDYRGIWRIAAALFKGALDGLIAGSALALGHGSAAQVDMGEWDNGVPFTPLDSFWEDDQPTPNEQYYSNPWGGNGLFPNPRYVAGWDEGDDPRLP